MHSVWIYFIAIIILIGISSCNTSESERLLFLGDSHIQRWDLDYYFPFSDNENQGISGETINGLSAKVSKDALSKYDLVVIQIGFNDGAKLSDNSVDIGQGVERMKESMSTMLSVIAEADTRIVLTSLIPLSTSYERFDVNCDFLQEYNSHLYNISNMYSNVYYKDIAISLKNIDECIDTEFLIDEIHLNRYGYSRISKAVNQIL